MSTGDNEMTPEEVYKVLKGIGADALHHANTVTTSATFLEQGGLLSRGYVETHQLKQTPQGSDEIDKKYGIWDGVFLDHVNIHHRGGRKKGPNQYGPVLFKLPLDILLSLPAPSEVRVTRTNPIHWTPTQSEGDRWYLNATDLANNIGFGDFEKMLVITTPTGKIEFPKDGVEIALDDPQRSLSAKLGAYDYAEGRLRNAAKTGNVTVDIRKHDCRSECKCAAVYAGYDTKYFEERFR
jgi:hypothetical protein